MGTQTTAQGLHHQTIYIIIDVLGGYSSETRENVILLLGKTKADRTLFNMQKAVISSTLNITRSFKVLS